MGGDGGVSSVGVVLIKAPCLEKHNWGNKTGVNVKKEIKTGVTITIIIHIFLFELDFQYLKITVHH